jgi:hypothetical protein
LSTLTGKYALSFAPAPRDAVARIENAEIERSPAKISDWDQAVLRDVLTVHVQLQLDDISIAAVNVTVLSSVLEISMVPSWAEATP